MSPLGFCHGSTGILCALARLVARTRQADLATTAVEEWEALAEPYDPLNRGWRLCEPGGQAAGLSWCNGTAGIVLGGAEVLPRLQETASLTEATAWFAC